MSRKRKVRQAERRKRQRQPPDPLWITLGLDLIEPKLIIMGWAKTREAALLHESRYPQATYVRVFEVFKTEGPQLIAWFRSCGLTAADAAGFVREYGRCLGEFAEEVAVEKGWIKSPR